MELFSLKWLVLDFVSFFSIKKKLNKKKIEWHWGTCARRTSEGSGYRKSDAEGRR
jgi:hypothetical protein